VNAVDRKRGNWVSKNPDGTIPRGGEGACFYMNAERFGIVLEKRKNIGSRELPSGDRRLNRGRIKGKKRGKGGERSHNIVQKYGYHPRTNCRMVTP